MELLLKLELLLQEHLLLLLLLQQLLLLLLLIQLLRSCIPPRRCSSNALKCTQPSILCRRQQEGAAVDAVSAPLSSKRSWQQVQQRLQ